MRNGTWLWGVNLNGVINGLQTFLPRLIERGEGGYIVNTASGAGLVAEADQNVLYATAKFAVVGLSESLRPEAGKYGIDVSVLCPGPVDTDISRNTRSADEGVSIGLTDNVLTGVEAFLKGGASIDSVGEMVIAGMEARSLWILTGEEIRPYLERRLEALLKSVPAPR
jgi:NAD(P)-dependent dehydrogenase (short-subunit alcohol dehydrogenase family)